MEKQVDKLEKIAKLMNRNNVILRDILKSQHKEVHRQWNPLNFEIDILNGVSSYTKQGSLVKLPFNFLLDYIGVRNETNALARIIFKCNGIFYPANSWIYDATHDYTANMPATSAFYSDATKEWQYPCKAMLLRPNSIEFYGINTHTSPQFVYVNFYGWLIQESEILNEVEESEG